MVVVIEVGFQMLVLQTRRIQRLRIARLDHRGDIEAGEGAGGGGTDSASRSGGCPATARDERRYGKCLSIGW